MAPVNLPPHHARVPLPPAPQDPPSHKDVTDALLYVDRARVAYSVNNVAPAVLSDAITYQAKIVSAKVANDDGAVAAAPPWFQPALNQLKAELKTELQASINNLQASMNNLQTSVDDLRTEFEENRNSVDTRLTSIERTCAVTHNMSVADGLNINFICVPFLDGSDPVNQHNLPALHTTTDIRDLTDQQLRSYYVHYVGAVGNRGRETQIKGVCKAIGVRQ